jgi:hypothetical protein
VVVFLEDICDAGDVSTPKPEFRKCSLGSAELFSRNQNVNVGRWSRERVGCEESRRQPVALEHDRNNADRSESINDGERQTTQLRSSHQLGARCRGEGRWHGAARLRELIRDPNGQAMAHQHQLLRRLDTKDFE